jgi:hypothetical protein
LFQFGDQARYSSFYLIIGYRVSGERAIFCDFRFDFFPLVFEGIASLHRNMTPK